MRLSKSLFFLFLLSISSEFVVADTDNVSATALSSQGPYTDEPFDLIFDYNRIKSAKVTQPHKSSHKHDHFSFQEGLLMAAHNMKINDISSLKLGLGFMKSRLGLHSHYHIQNHTFNNLMFLAAGTVKSLTFPLQVNGQLGVQLNSDHVSFRYSFYSGMLDAVYGYKENAHIHAGVIAVGGLRYSRALPILGFDWKKSDHWKFNLIFPTKMSAVYSYNSHFSFEAGARSFLSRQRFGECQPKKWQRGFIAYRGWGLEVAANYALNETIFINLHAGRTFDSRIRLSDHHDSHRRHLNVKGAPYWGMSAFLAF
jgi:hypothetical protein